jgi:hypothetical protein
MSRCVVDTNVPIVANGCPQTEEAKPSVECRMKAVMFLVEVSSSGTILLDLDGEIQNEYRPYLEPKGEPARVRDSQSPPSVIQCAGR